MANQSIIMRAGLLICLLITGGILSFSIFDTPHNVSAKTSSSQSARLMMQNSPLASPLAMTQPSGRQATASDTEANIEVELTAEEFQQRLPIYSGSRANQTSLFLIGAVLVGLVIVGTLVITRRD